MGGMGMGCMGMGGMAKSNNNDGFGLGDEEAARKSRPVGSCGAEPTGRDNFTLGKELVTQVMDDMPSYVTQDPRGFVLRSAVPNRMVGSLQKLAVQVMGST